MGSPLPYTVFYVHCTIPYWVVSSICISLMDNTIKSIIKRHQRSLTVANITCQTFSLSFYIKELNMLFVNFFGTSLRLYSTFLEKQLCLNDICNTLFSTLSMFFRVRLYKYSRKVRKILKNKTKFYTSYEFVKTEKRVSRVISLLKFCINLTTGHSFENRFFNMINSVLLYNKKSWVVRLKTEQELLAISNYSFK